MVDKPEQQPEETPEDPDVAAAERDAELLNKQSEVNAEADERWAKDEPDEDEESE